MPGVAAGMASKASLLQKRFNSSMQKIGQGVTQCRPLDREEAMEQACSATSCGVRAQEKLQQASGLESRPELSYRLPSFNPPSPDFALTPTRTSAPMLPAVLPSDLPAVLRGKDRACELPGPRISAHLKVEPSDELGDTTRGFGTSGGSLQYLAVPPSEFSSFPTAVAVESPDATCYDPSSEDLNLDEDMWDLDESLCSLLPSPSELQGPDVTCEQKNQENESETRGYVMASASALSPTDVPWMSATLPTESRVSYSDAIQFEASLDQVRRLARWNSYVFNICLLKKNELVDGMFACDAETYTTFF